MPETDVARVVDGTDFDSCYGCGKCTSGCPMAARMDIKPHQAMRLLQLGREDELLAAGSPWQCIACQTCLARCPNKIDIPAAFAQLCDRMVEMGMLDHAGSTPLLDDLFLGDIRRRGRVNDGLLAVRFKLRAGGLLSDWRIGMRMFRSGKLKLRVPGVSDAASVARLFDDVSKDEEETQ